MAHKRILKKTKFGNILAKKKGESLKSLAKRQAMEFKNKFKVPNVKLVRDYGKPTPGIL